jgi:hypothetical protein
MGHAIELFNVDHHLDLSTTAFRAAELEDNIRNREATWPALQWYGSVVATVVSVTVSRDRLEALSEIAFDRRRWDLASILIVGAAGIKGWLGHA